MKKTLTFFLLIFLTNFSFSQSEIFGLASPINLEVDTTVVYLEDYFVDVNAIKEIEAPGFLEFGLSEDRKKLILIVIKDSVPILSQLNITTAKDKYTILLRKSKKEKIQFQFDPKDSVYSKVSIVGEMTNWNPNVIFMENKNGIWQTELIMNPGRYQYQIVADGNWFLDPNNPVKIDNGIGGFNSLLIAGRVDNSNSPKIRTQNINGNEIQLAITSYSGIFSCIALWENIEMEVLFKIDEDTYEEVPVLTIPEIASNRKRSFIRVFNDNGSSEGNDILIPLEYGKVITDPTLLEKDDFQKTIMYFMMVDRFNNGDNTNDNPVKDVRVLPQANYYGGDLAGIKQKIDEGYFTDMGFNSLWISPVFQNPYVAYQEFPEPHRWFSGYHGYWPISLSKVDTRLGNNNLFKELIVDAHKNEMTVYLDYVANHIHAEHPLWKQHPEWFSNLTLPDGRQNLRLWDEQRLTTWFEPYMPSFDHSKPIVAEACADSAMFWLTEFDLDGFRHDATKHIETEFWRLLTHKIKTEIEIPQNRNMYQIGETFGSRELIGSYLGSGLLNAQFDFNLYFDARSVFANNDIGFERLSASLFETFNYYGYHNVMGNITGNHDMARFISYASGDLKWTDNDKEIGWHKTIMVSDTIGYAKLKMLHAFNMTIPGIPIVYYGDEIGMPGANDPDNRRMMRFDSLNRFEQDVKNTVTKLVKLRSEHMALLYGDFELISAERSTFIYKRSYFDDVVYVIFNNSPNNLPHVFEEDFSANKYQAQFNNRIVMVATQSVKGVDQTSAVLNVKPYSFEIVTVSK